MALALAQVQRMQDECEHVLLRLYNVAPIFTRFESLSLQFYFI